MDDLSQALRFCFRWPDVLLWGVSRADSISACLSQGASACALLSCHSHGLGACIVAATSICKLLGIAGSPDPSPHARKRLQPSNVGLGRLPAGRPRRATTREKASSGSPAQQPTPGIVKREHTPVGARSSRSSHKRWAVSRAQCGGKGSSTTPLVADSATGTHHHLRPTTDVTAATAAAVLVLMS